MRLFSCPRRRVVQHVSWTTCSACCAKKRKEPGGSESLTRVVIVRYHSRVWHLRPHREQRGRMLASGSLRLRDPAGHCNLSN
jgi:hypothetical protein